MNMNTDVTLSVCWVSSIMRAVAGDGLLLSLGSILQSLDIWCGWEGFYVSLVQRITTEQHIIRSNDKTNEHAKGIASLSKISCELRFCFKQTRAASVETMQAAPAELALNIGTSECGAAYVNGTVCQSLQPLMHALFMRELTKR